MERKYLNQVNSKIIWILFIIFLYSCSDKNSEGDSDSVPIRPGMGVSFIDQDTDKNQLSGEVVIKRASDESDITHYALFWGADTKTKLTGFDAITVVSKMEGEEDIVVILDQNTRMPEKADYFLVLSKNNQIENGQGMGEKIADRDGDLELFKVFGPGGNGKTGRYYYGVDYPALRATKSDEDDSICLMKNNHVSVFYSIYASGIPGDIKPFSFSCFENDFKEINGAYSPINDAFFFGQTVHDAFMEYLGTPPLGKNVEMKLRIHHEKFFNNSFWKDGFLNFGDSISNQYYHFVTLNMVSHEIAHGFSKHFSNLSLSGQGGAINEAFSDIAGEAVEYYLKGDCDYKFGYDVSKSEGEAMRYLDDPPANGSSIDSTLKYYTDIDHNDAAGVYNKAFYLLAESEGWNPGKAFQVFAHANMDYWDASTDFDSGAKGVYQSAINLGYNGVDVIEAFDAVDVLVIGDITYADFAFHNSFSTVNFINNSGSPNSTITSSKWDFGDGTTSTLPDPEHTYTYSGTSPQNFDVTLFVEDTDGYSIRRRKRVTVHHVYCESKSEKCDGEWISRVEIGDTSYASEASNYSNFAEGEEEKIFYMRIGKTYDINLTAAYCPDCTIDKKAWRLWIDFNTDGDFEDEGEMVFDGYDKGTVSGQITIPTSVSVEKTRIRFLMIASSAREPPCGQFTAGEVEDYTVLFTPPTLEADFTYTTSSLQVSVNNISFIPNYITNVNWLWNFGDGTTSTAEHPSPHMYGRDGTYTITLTAEDADNSSHVNTRSVVVTVITEDIKPDFEYTVESETTVSFQNTTTIPAGTEVKSWEWDYGDGSEKSNERIPADHTFPDFGSYSVTLVAVDDNDVAHSITKEIDFYCKSSGTYLDEYISKIAVNKSGESTVIFSNLSGSTLYSDFTHQIIPLESGSSYDVELNVTYPDSSSRYEECWALWIDFNNNSSFSDAGEKVLNTCAVGNFTQMISIPQSVSGGTKRARLTMKWSDPPTSPEPCGVFNLGEVEDYTVEIAVPD